MEAVVQIAVQAADTIVRVALDVCGVVQEKGLRVGLVTGVLQNLHVLHGQDEERADPGLVNTLLLEGLSELPVSDLPYRVDAQSLVVGDDGRDELLTVAQGERDSLPGGYLFARQDSSERVRKL